jgi:hypothetical protein
MIIKGKSRSGPSALAAHLGNAEKNERVALLETRGTVARDLRGALVEMDAHAAGTRCKNPLYHAAISPAPPHRLTDEQRVAAIDALEAKLGLIGHARVVVMHEKLGREHIHVVWSRINLNTMRSVSDSHNYRKHEEVARNLERRFGHERVQGAHHERDGVERPKGPEQDTSLEKDYGRGDDYVSQTSAALKDHRKRQKHLNGDTSEDATGRRIRQLKESIADIEARNATKPPHDEGPSRQREAPGGGRTRGR